MSPGPADDFLPTARPPDRVARRRARQTRQWAIVAGVVGTVVAVVVLISVLSGDDGSSARDRSTRGAHRRVGTSSTSTRRSRVTTTTSVGDGETTTSSNPPDGGAGSGSGGVAPPTTASPGRTPPPAGTDGGVTVTQDGGACAFDTSTEALVDTGVLRNAGTEEVVAEVEVTWFDDTGELDSWTDVESVPPGGSTAWSVSTAWPEPVQGRLRCEIALI